ncbi:bacterio-opsin activator domain-containing protein [Halomicrococcus gelatinilyticus]|uniref:bacterio-opsin activator domain-containing protein n=1 Tax=Halomicrococcus gelatinilyticus TaxID=1702103 RepID=UPI002E0F9B63
MDETVRSGTDEDVFEVFADDVGTPFTTAEVADALDCARRTAYNRLIALVERDLLETKKVGARGRVWWLPSGVAEVGRESTALAGDVGLTGSELFARICDTAPVGVAVVGPDHAIDYANERFATLLGRTSAAVTDGPRCRSVWRVFDEDDRRVSDDDHPVARVFETGRPVWGFRHGVTLPDGSDRWLSSNLAPIRSDGGSVAGVVVGLEDVTDLKERESHLRSQRAELLRLDRVNTVVRGIVREVTEARTREDIERAVCRHVARSDPYLFAVLGTFSSSYTEFTPNATAGIGQEYLDAMLGDSEAPPIDEGTGATAAKTREVQVVQNVTDLPYEHWERTAEEYRFRSYASVPLVHEGNVYGVLGVYARQPAAFDVEERRLLEELGEMVGYLLHSIEVTEKLRNEQVVELTFRSKSLGRPIVEHGGDALQVSGDGIVELVDGTYLQYYTVKGISTSQCFELIDHLPVADVRLLSTTDDSFDLEVQSTDQTLVSRLTTYDGEIASVGIDDDALTLVVQLPRTVDRESVVASVQDVYPDMELVSERLVFTPRTFRHMLETQLTDRQLTAVELAYHAGYFEQPRRTTGAELAAQMSVSTTTFHRHLRHAEDRIFRELLATSWATAP